jgi:hypothetical protein
MDFVFVRNVARCPAGDVGEEDGLALEPHTKALGGLHTARHGPNSASNPLNKYQGTVIYSLKARGEQQNYWNQELKQSAKYFLLVVFISFYKNYASVYSV